jgi:hypothetical protein
VADLSFLDLSDVVDTGTSDAVPADTYLAKIVDSDIKSTKSGTGRYVQVVWEIIEGNHVRRKIFDRFNVENLNTTASNIGKTQLKRLYAALGFDRDPQRTELLHGIPCRIKVSVKNDPQYGDSNEVKHYERVANARPGASMPPQPAAQSASAAPWNKSK